MCASLIARFKVSLLLQWLRTSQKPEQSHSLFLFERVMLQISVCFAEGGFAYQSSYRKDIHDYLTPQSNTETWSFNKDVGQKSVEQNSTPCELVFRPVKSEVSSMQKKTKQKTLKHFKGEHTLWLSNMLMKNNCFLLLPNTWCRTVAKQANRRLSKAE